jgi:hypothetical protein
MHPLNSEAGAGQGMPEDPRALAVIERAGDWCERAVPYLWWRYGERGYRFILSDTAYLIAMAELPGKGFARHLRWTADLLAQRGMPRWLLEIHCRQLARILRRAMADRPEIAETFEAGAELLAQLRHAHLREADFETTAALFADALGWGPGRLWTGFGKLLAAAVADERGGLERAVSSVTEWACDPQRFGARWITAVHGTVEAARQLAGKP